jgi:hypothetical protein
MNKLAVELVKGILSEAEVPRREVVGLFGGGFKPPTVGHLEVVQRAIQENPDLDRLIVLVGSGERDSITQDEALNIWRIYQKYLPKKVEIQPAPEGKPPIGAIYSYGKKNPDKDIYWFIGAREGNEDDFSDIMKRTKALRQGDYPNIKVKEVVTQGGVSGTKARKALLNRDKDTFIQYLPDIPEVDQIWDMLSDSMGINEEKNPIEINDRFLVRKGAFIYHEGKKKRLKRGKYFNIKEIDGNQYSLEDDQGRQFWIGKHEMCDKWSRPALEERISFTPDFISQDDVEFVDDLADRKLAPIDIDLSGNHFFDRLNDPRNRPDISIDELEEFFDKLADEKKAFIEFLKKYKDVVVKDTETNINIPFMKMANKAIAKTIMRKRDFKTPNVVLPLDEGRYDNETKMQSRYITNLFKAEFGKEFKDEAAGEGNIGNKKYTLQLAFVPTTLTSGADFEIDGFAYPKMIAINIAYNPEAFPEAYNELIAGIKNTVRHELEHFGQYHFDKDAEVDVPEEDYPSRFEYLTDDYEVAAHIQGLYKKAKTKKVPFTDVLEDFLDDELDVLSPKEIKLVRDQYLWYAKNNLPAAQISEADPKKGTGKKPKGSGRRLYTDENPKDTVKIKFSTRQDIVDTLNKASFKNKSHARQSQVINLIHQRVRAAYGRAKKPEVKKRLKTALDYITKRKEASKAKTQRLKNQKKKLNENYEGQLGSYIESLTDYMGSNGLNLKPYPSLEYIESDKENAANIFGRTAYYMPSEQKIVLYTMGRHPKDVLRSYAHELVHHHQNLNNTLDHSQTTNTNEDDDLDRIEREAYETGNILFRNWEDSIKNK